jgi:YVTN family beta-propeller protein
MIRHVLAGRVRLSTLAVVLAATAACSGSSTPTGGKPSPSGSASASPSTPPSAGRVVDRIKVGGQPCGITDVGGAVWVSDAERGKLLRIDPDTGTSRIVADLDASPCEITAGAGSLWVATQSGKLDRVNPENGRVVARIPVGATSYQAVLTPGVVWVSNRDDGTLTQVDPATNDVVRTVRLPDMQPGGMVYAAGALWIGDDTSGRTTLLRMDPRTRKTVRVIAGDRPAYLTGTPGAVWVSNVTDGTVSRIDVATNEETATLDVGLSPVNLKARGTHEVWVPDDVGNALVRIDADGAEVTGTVAAQGGPAVVRAAFGDIWVTMFGIGEVWRIRPS